MIYMNNKTKKIIGWVLLVSGLIIIFSDLYSSVNIFTARTSPPSVFKEIALNGSAVNPSSSVLSQEDLQKMMAEQLSKMIPQNYIFKLMNLTSWSIFAWILVLIGGKVSSIGVSLLREKKEKEI
jgi:hypothetical protein